MELISKLIEQHRKNKCEINIENLIAVDYQTVERIAYLNCSWEYDLYDVNVKRLLKQLKNAHDLITHKIENDIYALTPYMIERIYGLNVCRQILNKIYEDKKLVINAKRLYPLMKVQNVIVRETFASLYLNNRWGISDFNNHVKFESQWRYPILMYHVELLEEFFKNRYNENKNFLDNVSSAILKYTGTDPFSIKYYSFEKKPLKKSDMIEVEEFYKILWSRLYNRKNFSKEIKIDFLPRLSIHTIREILRDYL